MPDEKKQGDEARKEILRIYESADMELRAWMSHQVGLLLLRRKFICEGPKEDG